jgi:uncharacterized protein (TIGR00255 family)
MTVRSMTGYGAASLETPVLQASATVRSLNHRYFDLSLHLSRSVSTLEPEVKELVQARTGRGKLDVTLHVTFTGSEIASRVVARPFVGALVSTLRGLREAHGLGGDVTINDLARFGAVEIVEAPPEFSAERRDEILGVLRQALDHLEKMRHDEGGHLAADLESRLRAIESAVGRIEALMDSTRAARIAALQERVRALTQELGLEETRLYQEVVKLVDRQDTSEEASRLRSHLAQARALLGAGEAVGKRLDFLAQEFAREANTIGSKAASAAVTQEVVELKAEIEKLREQVQNVE